MALERFVNIQNRTKRSASKYEFGQKASRHTHARRPPGALAARAFPPFCLSPPDVFIATLMPLSVATLKFYDPKDIIRVY